MTEVDERRAQRLAKLARLSEQGIDPFPPRAEFTHTAEQAVAAFDPQAEQQPTVTVAGRLTSIRVMGKSTFAHLRDGSGPVQIYLQRDVLGEESYNVFRHEVDLGDFGQFTGELFATRTGEVTVRVTAWVFLGKTLRQMPDKWHGLRDTETRYRQRYLDLLSNEEVRDIFVKRTRIISAVRRFLDARGCLEVETPTLQPIYGGANARPFTTYHNELERTFYLRIADELYLKRLIIGGLDRVYEIAHNFRNEGVSTRHNPEFTACEVYEAYADYEDMMTLVEQMYSQVAQEVLGTQTVSYQGQTIDLTPPWRRVSMRDAILEAAGIDIAVHRDYDGLVAAGRAAGVDLDGQPTWGKLVEKLFDQFVEPNLIQPTFIVDYPIDISPLAKQKPGAPHLVERFEFFIGGLECGNAFTELNDPLEQRQRFEQQAQAAAQGEDETQPLDEDFILALEHGMPPTGGLGFGIDRMVMLLTDQTSIREVILFPQLREE
jgi:lysyl-tRNA synthetase class 2